MPMHSCSVATLFCIFEPLGGANNGLGCPMVTPSVVTQPVIKVTFFRVKRCIERLDRGVGFYRGVLVQR
jgi:hypothetical protein